MLSIKTSTKLISGGIPMKKLSLILAALLVGTSLIFVPAQATDAMGVDLLASADLYLNFENDSYQRSFRRRRYHYRW